MLKLTYTESGLHLERLKDTLEATIARRVLLSVRSGNRLYVEPGRASFLVPVTVAGVTHLAWDLGQTARDAVSLSPVDEDFVEIVLSGSWLAETDRAEAGVFLACLDDRAEFLVERLWQANWVRVLPF